MPPTTAHLTSDMPSSTPSISSSSPSSSLDKYFAMLVLENNLQSPALSIPASQQQPSSPDVSAECSRSHTAAACDVPPAPEQSTDCSPSSIVLIADPAASPATQQIRRKRLIRNSSNCSSTNSNSHRRNSLSSNEYPRPPRRSSNPSIYLQSSPPPPLAPPPSDFDRWNSSSNCFGSSTAPVTNRSETSAADAVLVDTQHVATSSIQPSVAQNFHSSSRPMSASRSARLDTDRSNVSSRNLLCRWSSHDIGRDLPVRTKSKHSTAAADKPERRSSADGMVVGSLERESRWDAQQQNRRRRRPRGSDSNQLSSSCHLPQTDTALLIGGVYDGSIGRTQRCVPVQPNRPTSLVLPHPVASDAIVEAPTVLQLEQQDTLPTVGNTDVHQNGKSSGCNDRWSTMTATSLSPCPIDPSSVPDSIRRLPYAK